MTSNITAQSGRSDNLPPLEVYNTARGRKEVFDPIDPENVRLYVCGPTVYDRAHIGNARPVVVFDVLTRLLRQRYPQVTYVRNITDVDDKINARSHDSGESIESLTRRTTQWFHDDMAALGNRPPDIEPRATQHIGEMIQMIECLISRGHAYEAEGHVLFDVPSLPTYGRLSGRSRDEMIAGARIEVAGYKRDPSDFVLWKPSESTQPGWESPWGRGRPGWHIECSAMSQKYLGETFDIHGGGHDLIFPHHENEIAQSTGCCGPDTFARVWMHNGHVVVNGEKMSKSLGNFLTVQDLLADAPGEAIRLALLETHYRQPLDWTAEKLERARNTLDRFYGALERVADVAIDTAASAAPPNGASSVLKMLYDDLNTPGAIAELHQLISTLNKSADEREIARLKRAILTAGHLMGLLEHDPVQWRHGGAHDTTGPSAEEIEALIEERRTARANRDFRRADEIRVELAASGITLEDGAEGTSWRRTG